MLDNPDAGQLDLLFRNVLGADYVSPLLAPFQASELDFNVLDRSQQQLASFANAWRSVAAVDPDRTFLPYLGFLKANQMWLTNSSAEQHGRDAQRLAIEEVADLLGVIAKARLDRGEPALDQTMLSQVNHLAGLGYERLVYAALAKVAKSPEEKKLVAVRSLAAFHGDCDDPAQANALRQFEESLDASPLSQSLVQQAYDRLVHFGGAENAYITGFLIAAADRQALPPSIISHLIEKARTALTHTDVEFLDSEYARILAHAMTQVLEPARPTVYELIAKVAASVTPLSSTTAEIYSVLCRQQLDTPAMFPHILAQARAAPPYRPDRSNTSTEPIPGITIVVSHGPWIYVLAEPGAIRPLSAQAIDVLVKQADDPALRDVIVLALAHQSAAPGQQCWKTRCSPILKSFSEDGPGRQLASDVLAQRLSSLPRAEFVGALAAIRKERTTEIEPEIRIALGRVTVTVQLARIRTNSR